MTTWSPRSTGVRGPAIAAPSFAGRSMQRWRTRGGGRRSHRPPVRFPHGVTTGTRTRRVGSVSSGAPIAAESDSAVLVLLDTTVLIDYLRGRPAVERVGALQTR